MKLNGVENQPSFGIRYLNKQAWNPKVLKNFENSKLLKGIDKKYPEATVSYLKMKEEDLFDANPLYTLVAKFKLAKNMVFRWALSSRKENAPEAEFVKYIKNATLSDMEFHSVPELAPMTKLNIRNVDSKDKVNK